MSKSIRPIFHLCLVVAAFLAVSTSAHAAVESDEGSIDGKVDVYYSAETFAPFKERKSNWSTVFSFGVDNFHPDKYRSRIGSETYEELFGTQEIKMALISIGTKYNTSIGSLGLSGHYGIGTVSGTVPSTGESVKLEIQKKGLEATFTLDALFDEPWVAPYVGAQVFNIDYDESDSSKDDSGATALASGLTVGVLLQLNALDPESALAAQNSVGLNNTFLNIFLSQYGTSGAEGDPNFETSFNWGAGFRLDF